MPLKKIARKARKTVKKIIPKEVRPLLHMSLHIIQDLLLLNLILGGIGNQALRTALAKGIIAGGTQFATDDEADFKDVARAGALAAAPDAYSW